MMVPTPGEAAARRDAWLSEQVRRLMDLSGATVVGWRGVEMAVRAGDEPQPRYGGDDVPCLVFWGLAALLNDGTALEVGSAQLYDVWGLNGRKVAPDIWSDRRMDSNGYRTRIVGEIPIGRVATVVVRLDAERDVVAEVVLSFGERELLLIAGEPTEDWSGRLSWHRLDESVLAFAEPIKAEQIAWVPGREPGCFREIT